jgi:hypothetical protein
VVGLAGALPPGLDPPELDPPPLGGGSMDKPPESVPPPHPRRSNVSMSPNEKKVAASQGRRAEEEHRVTTCNGVELSQYGVEWSY